MAYGFAAHAKKENIVKGKEVVMYNDLSALINKVEEKNNNRRAY
jgi:hypothetical protein